MAGTLYGGEKDMTKVDIAQHVNDADNLYMEQSGTVKRVPQNIVLNKMLTEIGLTLDSEGQLCAVTED